MAVKFGKSVSSFFMSGAAKRKAAIAPRTGTESVVHLHHAETQMTNCVKFVFRETDTDRSGDISKAELVAVLKRLMVPDSVVESFEAALTERLVLEDMEELVWAGKSRNIFGKFSLLLVCFVFPFLYAVSTRLPFIFVAVEVLKRGGEMWQVGVVLGVYQTCCATANVVSSTHGGNFAFRDHFLWKTASGLVGWIGVMIAPTSDVYALLFLGFVGLGEGIVELQSAIMRETRSDSFSGAASSEDVTKRFRIQYTSVCVGAIVAFFGGGSLYNTAGFEAVCFLGVSVNAVMLALSLLYVAIVTFGTQHDHSTSNAKHQVLLFCQEVTYKFCALRVLNNALLNESFMLVDESTALRDEDVVGWIKELYQAVYQKEQVFEAQHIHDLTHIMREGLGKDIKAEDIMARATKLAFFMSTRKQISASNSITEEDFVAFVSPRVHQVLDENGGSADKPMQTYLYVIVATQAVMGLCIGMFLSTSLLYYTQVHQLDIRTTGMLLGIGQGLAVLMMVSSQLAPKRTPAQAKSDIATIWQTITSRPLHIPFVVMLLGVLTGLYTLPFLPCAIVCQLLFFAFNDTSVSLLNELTATSIPPRLFKRSQSIGQTFRRLGSMLTAFTGPVLFDIAPWMPFVVYGGIVLAWGMFVVWPALYWHALEILPSPPKDEDTLSSCITVFRPFASGKQWHEFERDADKLVQKKTEDYQSATREAQIIRYHLAEMQDQINKTRENKELVKRVAKLERVLEVRDALIESRMVEI